jgi:hypothetical protein
MEILDDDWREVDQFKTRLSKEMFDLALGLSPGVRLKALMESNPHVQFHGSNSNGKRKKLPVVKADQIKSALNSGASEVIGF